MSSSLPLSAARRAARRVDDQPHVHQLFNGGAFEAEEELQLADDGRIVGVLDDGAAIGSPAELDQAVGLEGVERFAQGGAADAELLEQETGGRQVGTRGNSPARMRFLSVSEICRAAFGVTTRESEGDSIVGPSIGSNIVGAEGCLTLSTMALIPLLDGSPQFGQQLPVMTGQVETWHFPGRFSQWIRHQDWQTCPAPASTCWATCCRREGNRSRT